MENFTLYIQPINSILNPFKKKVNSFAEARNETLNWIKKHDLTSSNFQRGKIYKGTKQIATISYNGRIWDNKENEILINGTKSKKMPNKKNTTLSKIVAEAKRIQLAHPNMKWTNAIKDASKHIKEGAKTIVAKTKTAKKTAKKRVAHVKKSAHHLKRAFGIKGVETWYKVKPYTLAQIKQLNPVMFNSFKLQFDCVKANKVVKGLNGHGMFLVQKQRFPYMDFEYRVFKIHADGSLGEPKKFFDDEMNELREYVNSPKFKI